MARSGNFAADDPCLRQAAMIGRQIARAVIEGVAMVIARVIAISANFDIRVCHLFGEWYAFEGAGKVIAHGGSIVN